MAKKLIWKDNTEPPKDRIWIRLDETGNVIGIYEYNGAKWIKIATGSINSGDENSGGTWTGTAENMKIVTLDGKVIDVEGSQSANPNTVAVRTSTGQLKAADPISEDDLVTLKLMMWNTTNE